MFEIKSKLPIPSDYFSPAYKKFIDLAKFEKLRNISLLILTLAGLTCVVYYCLRGRVKIPPKISTAEPPTPKPPSIASVNEKPVTPPLPLQPIDRFFSALEKAMKEEIKDHSSIEAFIALKKEHWQVLHRDYLKHDLQDIQFQNAYINVEMSLFDINATAPDALEQYTKRFNQLIFSEPKPEEMLTQIINHYKLLAKDGFNVKALVDKLKKSVEPQSQAFAFVIHTLHFKYILKLQNRSLFHSIFNSTDIPAIIQDLNISFLTLSKFQLLAEIEENDRILAEKISNLPSLKNFIVPISQIALQFNLKETSRVCLSFLFIGQNDLLLTNEKIRKIMQQLNTKVEKQKIEEIISILKTKDPMELFIQLNSALADLTTSASILKRKEWDALLMQNAPLSLSTVIPSIIIADEFQFSGFSEVCETFLKKPSSESADTLMIVCPPHLLPKCNELLTTASEIHTQIKSIKLIVYSQLHNYEKPTSIKNFKSFSLLDKVDATLLTNDLAKFNIEGFFTTLMERDINEISDDGIKCWIEERTGELHFKNTSPPSAVWQPISLNITKSAGGWLVKFLMKNGTLKAEFLEQRILATGPFKQAVVQVLGLYLKENCTNLRELFLPLQCLSHTFFFQRM